MILKANEDRQAPVVSPRGRRHGKGPTPVASPRIRRAGHKTAGTLLSMMSACRVEGDHLGLGTSLGEVVLGVASPLAAEVRVDSALTGAGIAWPAAGLLIAAALDDEEEDEDEDLDDLDEDDEDDLDEEDEDLDEDDDEEYEDDDDLEDDDLDEEDEDDEDEDDE